MGKRISSCQDYFDRLDLFIDKKAIARLKDVFQFELGGSGGGSWYVEINSGRFGTTMHFYSAAGYNFPELALTLCLGETPERAVKDPIPEDTYWIRTLDCGPVLLPGSAVPKE